MLAVAAAGLPSAVHDYSTSRARHSFSVPTATISEPSMTWRRSPKDCGLRSRSGSPPGRYNPLGRWRLCLRPRV